MEFSPQGSRYSQADSELPTERTVDLLRGARDGDATSLGKLLQRHLPRLRRWAHGRMPQWTRGMLDTDDIVQETLLRTLKHVDEFESEGNGAFTAYLRRSLRNRITDEMRRAGRHLDEVTAGGSLPDHGLSPLEALVGREALEGYERALEALLPEHRAALVARLELGWSYQEIAEQLHKSSADAARMLVARALVRLATIMGHAS